MIKFVPATPDDVKSAAQAAQTGKTVANTAVAAKPAVPDDLARQSTSAGAVAASEGKGAASQLKQPRRKAKTQS